jgi:hypothetical protein
LASFFFGENMMKLEASKRLKAEENKVQGYDAKTFEIKVKCSESVYDKLINLLAAIEYNCNAGHSVQIGAFFDGDGSDKVEIDGLPFNYGRDMADACANYGDDLFALIDSKTAIVYNTRYLENDVPTYKITEVYPEIKKD